MARRSDHSREELFQMMVAAARRIIAAEGVGGLTARKVAKAVGYSPGSIYNVFKNLDDLIVQVNAETLDLLIADFGAISLSGRPEADLPVIVEHYLAFEEAHPNLWSALFDYNLKEGSHWPDWYFGKIEQLFTMAEAAVVPIYGDAPGRESRIAIQTLWAGLHGITSLARSGSLGIVADATTRSMAHHLTATYLAGMIEEKGAGATKAPL